MEYVIGSIKYLSQKINCCKTNHRSESHFNLVTVDLEITDENNLQNCYQNSEKDPLTEISYTGAQKDFLELTSSVKNKSLEALWSACENNDKVQVKLLLLNDLANADLNYSNKSNRLILHNAVQIGNIEILELLLNHTPSININCVDKELKTPLHWACIVGNATMIKSLLVSGALINAIDIFSNTALHYAILSENSEVVKTILSMYPDVDIRNNEGLSAIDLFKKKNFEINCNPSVALTISEYEEGEIELNISLPEGIQRSGKKIVLQDFEAIQILGKGSFGEVFLVKLKQTGELFAMKVLKKEMVMSQNLVKYVMAERNVLSYIRHPFIIGLKYAFQDCNKLFLVLEYCSGGNLAACILRYKKFSEEISRIYLCEILLAIEELHRRDIIYRDLKPENVVLDEKGHALLTDFGLSKEGVLDDVPNNSFCGSIAYLAPEMLKRKGHGKAVDWYLFGVIFYEMLVGRPPYYSNDREILMDNITHAKLKIPPRLTIEAKDLLKKLLKREPSLRLGSKNGAEEVKQHDFFKGVKWENVYNKELTPPIPPPSRLAYRNLPKHTFYYDEGPDESKVNGWTFVSE